MVNAGYGILLLNTVPFPSVRPRRIRPPCFPHTPPPARVVSRSHLFWPFSNQPPLCPGSAPSAALLPMSRELCLRWRWPTPRGLRWRWLTPRYRYRNRSVYSTPVSSCSVPLPETATDHSRLTTESDGARPTGKSAVDATAAWWPRRELMLFMELTFTGWLYEELVQCTVQEGFVCGFPLRISE